MKEKTKTKEQLINELKKVRARLAEIEQAGFRDREDQDALKDLMVAILDAMPIAVIGLKDRRVVFANHVVETVFGWRPEELVGQSTRVLYRNEEEFVEIANRFYPVLEKQKTYIDEFPCRHRDGRDITCIVSAARIGELLTERMIVVTYEDVTARRRAEEELQEYRRYLEKLVDTGSHDLKEVNEQLRHEIIERKQAEELYKTLAEKSIVAVFIVQDRTIRFINARAIAYAGYTPEELIGKDSNYLIHPEDRETVRIKTREMLQGKEPAAYEYRILARNGQVKWVMQTLTSIQYEGRPAILGNAMDISDRKRAEEEQRRREKLQGVLEMAGAVCHEMNQPMQVISGYAELLLLNTPENEPIYKKLDAIKKQIFRMGAITKKIMMIRDYESRDYAGFSRIINIHDRDPGKSEETD